MIINVMDIDSGEYGCIISNGLGDTNTSNVVVLMVTSELTAVW